MQTPNSARLQSSKPSPVLTVKAEEEIAPSLSSGPFSAPAERSHLYSPPPDILAAALLAGMQCG